MRSIWAAILMISACADPASPRRGAETASTDTSGTLTAGWDTASPWSLHDPALSAAEVVARIDDVLAAGLPDSPALMASLDRLVALGEPGVCGGDGRNLLLPMSGCTTESGWLMGGLLFYAISEDNLGYSATGDLFAVDPEGNRWIGAGDLTYAGQLDGGWRFEVAGTWGYVYDPGWPGSQPSLAMIVDVTPDRTRLDGGYMPGDDAVYFDAVEVSQEGLVSGTLSLRDPLGDWYQLPLDTTGCGSVGWGETTLGEGCVQIVDAVQALLVAAEAPQ